MSLYHDNQSVRPSASQPPEILWRPVRLHQESCPHANRIAIFATIAAFYSFCSSAPAESSNTGISLLCHLSNTDIDYKVYLDLNSNKMILDFETVYNLTYDSEWYHATFTTFGEFKREFRNGTRYYDQKSIWFNINRLSGRFTVQSGVTSPDLRAEHRFIAELRDYPDPGQCMKSGSSFAPRQQF